MGYEGLQPVLQPEARSPKPSVIDPCQRDRSSFFDWWMHDVEHSLSSAADMTSVADGPFLRLGRQPEVLLAHLGKTRRREGGLDRGAGPRARLPVLAASRRPNGETGQRHGERDREEGAV